MSDETSLEVGRIIAMSGYEVAPDTFLRALDRIAELESELQELQELRDLVTEAARVTFDNASPHEYPLSVWSHAQSEGHPCTWGATMDTLGNREGRLTPEVITHALKKLREEEAGDDD